MIQRTEDQLTPIQRAVLEAIRGIYTRTGHPVSIEQVSVETLIAPDAVVRAATVLAEGGFVQVHEPERDAPDLELEVAGAAR